MSLNRLFFTVSMARSGTLKSLATTSVRVHIPGPGPLNNVRVIIEVPIVCACVRVHRC